MTLRETTIPRNPENMTRDELLFALAEIADQLANALDYLVDNGAVSSDETKDQIDGTVSVARQRIAAAAKLTR